MSARKLDPSHALSPEFYDRPVERVARELLGATLVAEITDERIVGTIVETEAYGGAEDLASHAAFRRTGVVAAMYGPPGTLYVYKAYGTYPCLNIVTGAEGAPSAVLIRAMSIECPEPDNRSASGPGRLGRRIGLDLVHNGHPVVSAPYWIQCAKSPPRDVAVAPRVGVRRGDGRHWRFAVARHPAVSRPRI